MGGKVSVFLSYRRADAPYAAGRLADRLGERFELFMDIDIAPGLHFGQALTDAVSSCDVMLVLIGQSWLDAVDDDGRRRLREPAGLGGPGDRGGPGPRCHGHPGAGGRRPDAATPPSCPRPLESLGFRQAISLRHESFATDIRHPDHRHRAGGADRARGDAGAPRDRNVEQRLVNAWRQLRGEPEAVATASPPRSPPAAGSSVPPCSRRRRRPSGPC